MGAAGSVTPQLSVAESAWRDAEAERDFEAGEGIPAGEVFAWLHDRIDGGQKTPVPKARKISQSPECPSLLALLSPTDADRERPLAEAKRATVSGTSADCG